MTMIEILTLFIALYGAGLATILGIRELRRDRRRISVIVEYVAFYERAQLTITNVGYRPITITEVGMVVSSKQNEKELWEAVPRNALFALEGEEPFPKTLGDGEPITLPLGDVVSESLYQNNMRARVSVYDVEGNEYTEFKTRLHNPKWGHYDKIKKS